ncbi:hemerythrin domain-containing protein [Mycolicibacterium sp. CH28]|uniref:hemerythrin domain-containing protein n=1 Tax=Mycolicibacterium sp. CH28 TaxID=2512237 RepID=UPI00107FE0D1|nr:hemerythrin domain-containing protein [Mycolicibacterium sp. CH28]TGD85153.1 hemerythrin domain-containing protein [Mycolicibacterium sp. CH28]
MKTMHPVTVVPRQPGEPDPDVRGLALAHRALLNDVGRLIDAVAAIRDGQRCNPGRARAIARYTELMCDSIHHHHTVEDEVLWPVIDASAGDMIDLTELTEDHAALDPRLDVIRRRANGFRVAGGDVRTAGLLAAELSNLLTLLTEHIVEEERDIFPVIRDHLSVASWQAVEETAQRTGRLSFDLPRMLAVMTDDERATMITQLSPVMRVVMGLAARRYRKFERTVFASADSRDRNAAPSAR